MEVSLSRKDTKILEEAREELKSRVASLQRDQHSTIAMFESEIQVLIANSKPQDQINVLQRVTPAAVETRLQRAREEAIVSTTIHLCRYVTPLYPL